MALKKTRLEVSAVGPQQQGALGTPNSCIMLSGDEFTLFKPTAWDGDRELRVATFAPALTVRADGGRGRAFNYSARDFSAADAQREQPHCQVGAC